MCGNKEIINDNRDGGAQRECWRRIFTSLDENMMCSRCKEKWFRFIQIQMHMKLLLIKF